MSHISHDMQAVQTSNHVTWEPNCMIVTRERDLTAQEKRYYIYVVKRLLKHDIDYIYTSQKPFILKTFEKGW